MASRQNSKPLYGHFWKEYLVAQRDRLPPLPEVDNVSSRVVRILGGNPGNMQLQGTNTYLVGTGSSRILIDTGEGFPKWASTLTGYVQSNKLSLSYVLLTHWHTDHTGGVADLVAYDSSLASRVYKHRPSRGQQPIADRQVFTVAGATVRAVLTPGHAIDHMCFVLQEDNALFTGDNVLGHGYSVAEDLGAYTTSLRRMQELSCAVGYPGHGEVIRDLPRRIERYIKQREARERHVLAALVKGAASAGGPGRKGAQAEPVGRQPRRGISVAGVAQLLYGELCNDLDTLETALIPLLSQVLWKLAGDGRVGFELVGSDRSRNWYAHAKNSP